MTTPSYISPPSSKDIAQRQNDAAALRLLLAQRRLYTKAKFWQRWRWMGLILVGLAAPVVAVVKPDLALAVGALAGAWLFLGRTILSWRVGSLSAQAAAVQESFDHYVFSMPISVARSTMPLRETIARLTGTEAEVLEAAGRESLWDWYPIDLKVDGSTSIAIALRANASYTSSLLRSNVLALGSGSVAWTIMLVSASVVTGMPSSTFLIGVFLPLLPAGLDVVEYLAKLCRAATTRSDLAQAIDARITGAAGPSLQASDLLVWQSEMYVLRCTSPLVPDWLYRMARLKNEEAMRTAAEALGRTGNEPAQ